jgi:hypothetical protein
MYGCNSFGGFKVGFFMCGSDLVGCFFFAKFKLMGYIEIKLS